MAAVRVFNPYVGAKEDLKKKLLSIVGQSAFYRLRAELTDAATAYYAYLSSKVPLAIELETQNRCNYTCTFCPVSVKADPRAYQKMRDALLEKIADDLQGIDYGGLLALFSNNEPLLDERIVDIAQLLRQKAKRAHIYIYTNGTKLTADLFIKLFEAGLDELRIDNYNDTLELIRPVANLLAEIDPLTDPRIEEYKAKTIILLRKRTEVLTNRAGTAPNKKTDVFTVYDYFQMHSCPLPFMQLVIRPSGEISMCCQDALGKATLGDLRTQSIREVWNGKKYRELRLRLNQDGRHSVPICAGCDVYEIPRTKGSWSVF